MIQFLVFAGSFAGLLAPLCRLMLNSFLLCTKEGLMNFVQRGKIQFHRETLSVSRRSVIIRRHRAAILHASISCCWETDLGEIIGDKN